MGKGSTTPPTPPRPSQQFDVTLELWVSIEFDDLIHQRPYLCTPPWAIVFLWLYNRLHCQSTFSLSLSINDQFVLIFQWKKIFEKLQHPGPSHGPRRSSHCPRSVLVHRELLPRYWRFVISFPNFPSAFLKCAKWTCSGIFRKSANVGSIKRLREKINRGLLEGGLDTITLPYSRRARRFPERCRVQG